MEMNMTFDNLRSRTADDNQSGLQRCPGQLVQTCAVCPHRRDCQKVGKCLDDVNAEYLSTRPNQFPRLMTPTQATTFMSRLQAGEAVRRMTSGGKLGKAVCSLEKFKKHCAAYPMWGEDAQRLAKINAKAADIMKSVNAWKRKKTQELCLKGLHPMKGDNLMIHKGRRACLACWRHHATHPPIHSILPVLDLIKDDLRRGISLGQICHGKPTGGGKLDYSLMRVRPNVFYYYRKLNPDFDQFVRDALAGSNSRGQKIRWTRVHTASVRDSNNEYYRIRAMIPAENPHRDDIVARIFEDLLGGSLKREEVAGRIKQYVAELNKLYPTKYAKFGDSPLYSLDEALFDDGNTTRGDNISQGLWG
jgi:hypothetical protein